MFAESGMELPMITQILALQQVMQKYFYIVFPAIGAVIVLLSRWAKTQRPPHHSESFSEVAQVGPIFKNSAIGSSAAPEHLVQRHGDSGPGNSGPGC